MYDMDGWEPVTCVTSDELRDSKRPASSLTDPHGNYSSGVVFTEWWERDDDTPVLRDYRWTDDRPCEHFRWVGAS